MEMNNHGNATPNIGEAGEENLGQEPAAQKERSPKYVQINFKMFNNYLGPAPNCGGQFASTAATYQNMPPADEATAG